MGIYAIYEFVFGFVDWFINNKKVIDVIAVTTVIAFATWLIMFILQGVGLYKMAKKRNMRKKFLAFIPVANIYYMGKLSGDSFVFGQRMKHSGLYATIAETVSSSLFVTALILQYSLYFQCGDPLNDVRYGIFPYWDVVGGGSLNALVTFYNAVVALFLIFQLIAALLMIILLSALYRKYAPKQYFLLGFLTIFLPARYIIVFALRNRNAIDYEAYMRARREAYIRQQQQYNQQSYGGYDNSYNPYAAPRPPQQNTPKKPEDPFEEFSSGNKADDSSSGGGENPEDFFN